MQPFDSSEGIPAFLSKLWKIVNDPVTDNLISWSKDGKSFIIKNEVEFWYTLLPVYYKHNNMSSFIRQLNMYGFHKIQTLEKMDVKNEKIEYQFMHPCFKKGQPHLLKNIKRKVTNSKLVQPSEAPTRYIEDQDQIGKVLADVKYLHGRQTQVDGILNNLKQENSVLWRELAVLRQKHQKQQQIVNKPSRMGVKRRYPLMIHGTSDKKAKTAPSDGPTIHELDNADLLSEGMFDDSDDQVQVSSPASTSQQSQPKSPSSLVNEKEVEQTDSRVFPQSPHLDENNVRSTITVDELLPDNGLPDDAIILEDFDNDDEDPGLMEGQESDKIFLNSSSQDTILTNLLNGSYNENLLNGSLNINNLAKKEDCSTSGSNMAVATRDPNMVLSRLNSVIEEDDACCSNEEIDHHIGNTQNELDQLKGFLNNCGTINSIDSSYLLNLFNDMPSYGLTPNQSREDGLVGNDLLSGSELAPYGSEIVDFNELFDDSIDAIDSLHPNVSIEVDPNESINTPDVSNIKPAFPAD